MKDLLLLTSLAATATATAATRPNLLIVHTDEHTFRTLSCYQELLPEDQAYVWGKGNNVETPNIDRIAHEGTLCTNYFCAVPTSTPSRASMITGLYPKLTGAWENGQGMREDIPTFASILRDNGYSTSYVGKWHLEEDRPNNPTQGKYLFDIEYNGGFEDNRYMMTGGHAPYFHLEKDGSVKAMSEKNIDKYPKQEIIHLTDYFTDKSIEIIERDKDTPFCLMVSIPDPHTPDYARPPYHTMYEHMDIQMPRTMEPDLVAARPAWIEGGNNEAGEFTPERVRQYFGMVKHIDDSVGRMIECLEANGILDNTIVIFTSDHGDMLYEHKRMNKGKPYQSSANIPFVIRYPKSIPAGKVITKAYTNCDFTPTTLALMGIKTSAKFQGEDLSKDFTSKRKVSDQHRMVHFHEMGSGWGAVADDRYKLVVSEWGAPWLVDMKVDPFENRNFYGNPKYAAITARLMAEIQRVTPLYHAKPAGQSEPAAFKYPEWIYE